MNPLFKTAGIIGVSLAMVSAMGLAGCTNNAASAPNNNTDTAFNQAVSDREKDLSELIMAGTGEYVFQDADDSYWAADTAVSEDGRSITVWLPMSGPEGWTFTMVGKPDCPIDALEEPAVSEDGQVWSVTLSGVGIDPTGEVEVVFSQRYPAGSQPEKRQFVIGLNVENDDTIRFLGAKGAGFPAEWYDQDPGQTIALRLPVAQSGKWEFTTNDEVLQVLAGPADDGDVTAISYRALKAGEAPITALKLDDKGAPEYSGTLQVKVDEAGVIAVQSAEWAV